jgi:hypothetical protein
MKNSFVLYTEIRAVVEQLTNEQKGMLFQAILDYESGKEPDLSEQAVRVAFIPIKQNLDRCDEKWEEERLKRSDAGKKGMESRWGKRKKDITSDNTVITNDNTVITNDNSVIPVITNDNKALQGITKITDNVNVNVNVNDINNTNTSIDYNEIVNLFNSTCTSLSKIQRLTDKRKKAIKTRLKTFTIDDYKKAFQMVEESDFLSGRSGSWKASFDWLLNEANLIKVLEGNYKNNKTSRIEINPEFRRFQEEHELVHFNVN